MTASTTTSELVSRFNQNSPVNGFTFFDGTFEHGPPSGWGGIRLIVTMGKEKVAVVGHDQHHGGA